MPRNSGQGWVYGSIGAWQVTADTGHGYEFFVLAGEDYPMLAAVVCAAAHYHANPGLSFRLGLGHIVPIGEGFLGGACDHLLVSSRIRSAGNSRSATCPTTLSNRRRRQVV